MTDETTTDLTALTVDLLSAFVASNNVRAEVGGCDLGHCICTER